MGEKSMRKKEYLWWVGYVCAALIFGYGVLMWGRAACYTPADPEAVPGKRYRFASVVFNQPLTRYSRLLHGDLFFEATSPATAARGASPRRDFQSDIKVYGMIRGGDPRAVVGIDGEAQTWIVRPGSVVHGERIVAIAAKYVVVENDSGAGKVFY
jgi:hypothetical protein